MPSFSTPFGLNAMPAFSATGIATFSPAAATLAPASGCESDLKDAKCAAAGNSGTACGVVATILVIAKLRLEVTAKLNAVGLKPNFTSPIFANLRSVAR